MSRADRLSGLEKLLARKSVGRILRIFFRPPDIATNQLDVRQAYRLWAPAYASETSTHYLDDELARAMLQGLPQTHLLDAGCGAGSRIRDIPGAFGIDLSPEMLAAGGLHTVVAGDIREMPFEPGQFDMVWCRLVLGHLRDPFPAYREFCRVCMPGGYVFVTDFHPDATLAGHRRTFNDEAGVVQKIEHYEHRNHVELALQAGLEFVSARDGAVGPSVHDFYVHGIGRKAYIRDFGLNLVRAFLFRRPEDARL
jgi:SAM-dependent methyltransferase